MMVEGMVYMKCQTRPDRDRNEMIRSKERQKGLTLTKLPERYVYGMYIHYIMYIDDVIYQIASWGSFPFISPFLFDSLFSSRLAHTG